jgi:hypothetical protein
MPSFFYLPLYPVFKGAKEGARKGTCLSRPFGLPSASRCFRDVKKLGFASDILTSYSAKCFDAQRERMGLNNYN